VNEENPHPFSLDDLDEEQREAACAVDGPVLILAGPGTGKTRTLVYRLAHMVLDCGFAPDRVLMVAFTNKAAAELRERTAGLLAHKAHARLAISTLHAFCLRLLRREIHRLGRSCAFEVCDAAHQDSILAETTKQLHGNGPGAREVRSQISLAKCELLSPEDYAEQATDQARYVAEAYAVYQRALREAEALDFDDLVFYAVRILSECPDVSAACQDAHPYVMVDEYQDINVAQYRLIRLLAQKHGNLCAVGDADQAIYAFRGANVRNFLDFRRDFPEARVVHLIRNYRSTNPILGAAEAVIQKNRNRLPHRLVGVRGAGERVRVHVARGERHQAQFITHAIRRAIGGASFVEVDADMLDREAETPYGFSDFAVLFRTNAEARALEAEFRRTGIPYQFVGTRNLADQKEVQDVLACIRLALDPDDAAAQERVTRVSPRASASLMRELAEATTRLRAAEVVRQVVALTGMKDEYDDGTDEGARAYDNLLLLATLAGRYEQVQAPESARAFVEDMLTSQPADAFDERANRVALLTLHAAKGLEFAVVFIVGVEDGLIPHAPPGEMLEADTARLDDDTLEEERRLLYVGMTRARDRLYLLRVNERHVFGSRRRPRPSRFLTDVPRDLVEFLAAREGEDGHSRKKKRRRPRGRQLRLFGG